MNQPRLAFHPCRASGQVGPGDVLLCPSHLLGTVQPRRWRRRL